MSRNKGIEKSKSALYALENIAMSAYSDRNFEVFDAAEKAIAEFALGIEKKVGKLKEGTEASRLHDQVFGGLRSTCLEAIDNPRAPVIIIKNIGVVGAEAIVNDLLQTETAARNSIVYIAKLCDQATRITLSIQCFTSLYWMVSKHLPKEQLIDLYEHKVATVQDDYIDAMLRIYDTHLEKGWNDWLEWLARSTVEFIPEFKPSDWVKEAILQRIWITAARTKDTGLWGLLGRLLEQKELTEDFFKDQVFLPAIKKGEEFGISEEVFRQRWRYFHGYRKEPQKPSYNKYSTDSEFIRDLEHDITAFVKAGSDQVDKDEKFNDIALRLFEYQFNANLAYQKYCRKRGTTLDNIGSWMEIPAVPTYAFKEVDLCTFPPEQAVKVLTSSGTTDPAKRSTLYYDELGLRMLHLSGQETMNQYLLLTVDKVHTLLLTPPPQIVPNLAFLYTMLKSLEGHMLGDPKFFVTHEGFDFQGLVDALKQVEAEGVPVILMGATFIFVHFFDFCKSQGVSFNLPEHSILRDGGGYKRMSQEIPPKKFIKLAQDILGLPDHRVVNTYGLSELTCVFPDNVLYNHAKGIKEPRYKMIPHWTKTVVVDPDTFEPLSKGKTGLLRHYCLTNVSNVMVVQTDDLGYAIGSGFECLGRAKGAEVRGCSIATDELISAQKI